MRRFHAVFVALVLVAAGWLGCSKGPAALTGAPLSGAASGATSAASPMASDIGRAMAAQNRHTDRLLAIHGVIGTATSVAADGSAVVLVLTRTPGVIGVPHLLDNEVPVVLEVSGELVALKRPGTAVDPRSRFARPVPIGVSAGNAGECSSGTIGARVKSGGAVYALSNNHVFALENAAANGSNILQPGRYDTACAISAADVMGTLFSFEPIVFSTSANNTMDAAIALTSTLNLGNATPSNGYGAPSSSVVAAFVGQAVKKYGRTTSLTRGKVSGINATVSVGYGAGTARFVDQILVQTQQAFIKSGDSGSLMVSDNTAANPVGLLFAANTQGTFSIANRIDLVLNRFGVTIDGK